MLPIVLGLLAFVVLFAGGKKSRAEKEEKKGPRRPEKKQNPKVAAIQAVDQPKK